MWTPFVVLLVTAALISVPEPLQEAAKIDGASPVQRFRYITLPLIRPVLLVVILFRVIDIVKIADIPYTVTQGGPGASTDFLSLLIYRTSFKTFNIGGGAAMSVVFVLMLMLPVLALYRLTRNKTGAK
jgi:ABC-type sugar transport system permease subunit